MWTDEQTERLRKMWLDGYRAADIGAELGVSKNAVIGRAHRMGLATHKSAPRILRPAGPRLPRSTKPPAPKPVGVKITDAIPAPPVRPVTITDLESRHCRWIRDDGLYCGGDKVVGSYCGSHARRAYVQRDQLQKHRPAAEASQQRGVMRFDTNGVSANV